MTDNEQTQDAALNELWDQLAKVRAGMLGLDCAGGHVQPMTHHVDRENRAIWFIASADSTLVETLGEGATGHFTLQTPDQDYYACLRGTVRPSASEEKLDEIWSTVASAFFEEGRDDWKVRLLKMPLREVECWSTRKSRLLFGLELLRAATEPNATPDLGEHHVLDLSAAA
ncbi:general stress protein [Maritimibacter sp. 55A14]|uniref:pyridoxamine 5'-phosphate oxidase family protein n=1 Tax=Maritimibacter sp. 55A14 TaxID=2174844 RepID=UPI000D619D44|nr:pyridoxamine 5'-phosphate oxidase family protein [Maritimibacter sp. 55A14]PWE33482.1 general stress protein [Maritimibacter sp. 55A14]